MKTALELSVIRRGKYPDPDNYTSIYHEDILLLWKQGIVGKNVINQLNEFSEIPFDPLFYQKNYTYSVNYNNRIYQLGYLEEM